jgi:predicted GNAT superfamily acetyltransferase
MNPTGATGSSPSSRLDPSPDPVVVRALESHEELKACVRLQKEIWGQEYEDVVPASILQISQKVGGVAAGAFVDEGAAHGGGPDRGGPVGFVYGITGVREGKLSHWSHMLGVLRGYRGRGIGQRLKLFQRAWLEDRGVEEIRWTFDPLVSGNAHFNLNLLGVEIAEYVPDMYDDTGSGLHSFGTDRFIAHWDLGRPIRTGGHPSLAEFDWEKSPVLNPEVREVGSFPWDRATRPEAVRIEIPRDIVGVNREDPSMAMAWRRATRSAFQAAGGEGYRIIGFARSKDVSRCHYLLLHPSANGDGPTGGENP